MTQFQSEFVKKQRKTDRQHQNDSISFYKYHPILIIAKKINQLLCIFLSINHIDKIYDPLQEIGLLFDIRILQSLSFPDQKSIN